MSEYEIVKNLIRLTPFLLMAGAFLWTRKDPWRKRISAVVPIGWVLIAVSTIVYWKYAVQFAPTEEIRIAVTEKDGAPKLMALMFGWIYSFLVYCVFEIIKISYDVSSMILERGVAWIKGRRLG